MVVVPRMHRAAKSFITSLGAGARLGRASRLRNSGKKEEAISVAREALEILSRPHIVRTNPAEASVLAFTTILVEELASELNQSGAGPRDISDSLSCIRAQGTDSDLAPWIPYLESRLGQGGGSAV